MANKKFSQFTNGGALQPSDTIVGLRAGVNTKFNAPGVTGDVFGPDSSVDGHLAIFDGTTGKLIADGGTIPTGDVEGPSSAVDNHVALFNGPSGKVIKDGGVLPTGDVKGPGSSISGHVAIFNGITGKLIADGGPLPTGDVSGPSSAVSGHIAVFDGVTGKIIADGGPVPSAGGLIPVYVTGGYQLVAPNTLYYTQSLGKVIFQIPVTFPKGSTFGIVGASDSQNGWELWTQLNQSLIYQNVITDLAPNIYATASSNYYRDCATFTCINDNLEIQCIQYDGAGLSISQEVSVDVPLTTVTVNPSVVYGFAKLIDSYTGYLAKLFRVSDGAVAYVSPDFANRLSQVSDLDVGVKLADWAAGDNVNIQMLDQSGNSNDATTGGVCLILDSAGNMSNISGRGAAQTAVGVNFMEASLPFFSDPEFTLLALATRYADSDDSSIATLYSPGNGDDYGSPLNNVCFHEIPENTDFISVRDANLSTKSIPALNTRMTLTNLFDGANNTMSINGVNGTTVASSGSFSFNKLLMGARYVSGGVTAIGSYRIGAMILYPDSLSAPEISDLISYIDFYL